MITIGLSKKNKNYQKHHKVVLLCQINAHILVSTAATVIVDDDCFFEWLVIMGLNFEL